MNEFADNILGYGSKRFIEVFFRGFKNDTWGYSSSQPAKTVSVFGATEGRLSIMQPNSQQSTKVATKKSVVTIFLDIEEAEVEQYQSDDLSTAFFDRESQEVITKAELQDIIEENDSVDDSLVAYQSVQSSDYIDN